MTEPPPLTGAEVRDIREAAGLSQVELATLSGLSRATIQLIEYGSPISAKSERRLRAALSPYRAELALPVERLQELEAQLNELKARVDDALGTEPEGAVA